MRRLLGRWHPYSHRTATGLANGGLRWTVRVA